MIIGITGGIGSGKSFICDIFNYKYNLFTIDSDSIVNNILMYYIPIILKISNTFGEDSYIDGRVNVEKFRNILWNNNDNLTKMNDIIVPYLIDYIKNVPTKNKIIIFECPIILNTDIHNYVDYTILVKCDTKLRKKRLMDRYGDIQLVTNKINSQSFDENKVNYILNNNNNNNLESQIEKIIQEINT